jgi:hypothetical protein
MNKVSNSPSSDQSHNPIHAAKLNRGITKELAVQTTNETDYQRKVRELAEHRPSFDLGFSQVEETLTEQKDSEHAVDAQAVPERAVANQTVGQQPVAE